MDKTINHSPNDFKVVLFTNTTDFTFTPDMGCMYDGRPISGITGAPGVNGGESLTVPYHIGHCLARNLAKIVKLRRAPIQDEANNPVGKPLWSDEDLEGLKNSFLTELYSEQKPVVASETDRLMAQVEEYKKMVEQILPKKQLEELKGEGKVETPVVAETPKTEEKTPVFADKQDVITELEKRGVKVDRRMTKEKLEALLK